MMQASSTTAQPTTPHDTLAGLNEAAKRLRLALESAEFNCPNYRDYYPNFEAFERAGAKYRATCQGIMFARERISIRRRTLIIAAREAQS